jgi:hypothetical protein
VKNIELPKAASRISSFGIASRGLDKVSGTLGKFLLSAWMERRKSLGCWCKPNGFSQYPPLEFISIEFEGRIIAASTHAYAQYQSIRVSEKTSYSLLAKFYGNGQTCLSAGVLMLSTYINSLLAIRNMSTYYLIFILWIFHETSANASIQLSIAIKFTLYYHLFTLINYN